MLFETNSQVKNTPHWYLNKLIDSILFLLVVARFPGSLIASAGNTFLFPVSLGQGAMAACGYSQASNTTYK